MPDDTRQICEAFKEPGRACRRLGREERDGRPVCAEHARTPDVLWKPRTRTCPTCGGSGVVNYMGWGVNSHLSDQVCPDCLGDGYFDEDPAVTPPKETA
ncbi:MAG TPA: hypothetical protein VGV38_21380 [Pyrinomonadaceae bacterium]|nr:hypothetical protein [Pyrinomonadaceae bacterium]